MKKFKGIFTALLTPFDDKLNINFNSLEKLIEFNLSHEVNGFYVCGSTGEGMLLSLSERKAIFQFVSKIVKGRATLIGHVGTINTLDAIDMAKCAEECGFDAISAVPPYYYAFSYEAIKGYYNDIASSVKIPMIIYNFPSSGGFSFTPDVVREIFMNPKFIGIKHTSTDLYTLERFKNINNSILVYNGFDEMLLAGLSMGADGGIGSTYNFMPNKIVQIYRNFLDSNISQAKAVQLEVNDIISQLIKYGVFVSEKEILTNLGIPMGPCRKPFLPISQEGKKVMALIAEKLK